LIFPHPAGILHKLLDGVTCQTEEEVGVVIVNDPLYPLRVREVTITAHPNMGGAASAGAISATHVSLS